MSQLLNELKNSSNKLDSKSNNFLDNAIKLAEAVGLDTSKEIKSLKQSTKSLSASKLLEVANLFEIDAVDFFLGKYCEKAAIDKISGKENFINQRYLNHQYSSTNFLKSLLSYLPSKDAVEAVLKKLQISPQFLNENKLISIFAIKDASIAAKNYLNNETNWQIGIDNCQSMKAKIQSQNFHSKNDLKSFYEELVENSHIVEENFSYEIESIKDDIITIVSEQKNDLIHPTSYSTDYINTTRAAFLAEVASVLPGLKNPVNVTYEVDSLNRTVFKIRLGSSKVLRFFN